MDGGPVMTGELLGTSLAVGFLLACAHAHSHRAAIRAWWNRGPVRLGPAHTPDLVVPPNPPQEAAPRAPRCTQRGCTGQAPYIVHDGTTARRVCFYCMTTGFRRGTWTSFTAPGAPPFNQSPAPDQVLDAAVEDFAGEFDHIALACSGRWRHEG